MNDRKYGTGHLQVLRDRIWGAASGATAIWAAQNGMHLQGSTLKYDENGLPLHFYAGQWAN